MDLAVDEDLEVQRTQRVLHDPAHLHGEVAQRLAALAVLRGLTVRTGHLDDGLQVDRRHYLTGQSLGDIDHIPEVLALGEEYHGHRVCDALQASDPTDEGLPARSVAVQCQKHGASYKPGSQLLRVASPRRQP